MTRNFYARLSAITPQEPVSGVTVVPDRKGSADIAQKVIDASRANYAKKYATKTKQPEAGESIKDTAEVDKSVDDGDLPVVHEPASS